MIARRFAVFAFSAAVGYGIALHELPKHRAAPAGATLAHITQPARLAP